MKYNKRLFITLILVCAYSISIYAQRMVQPLTESWKFHKGQALVTTPTQGWQEVTLPHTWNAVDGQQSGKNRLDANGQAAVQPKNGTAKKTDPTTKYGYYRGEAWYAHELNIPKEWSGKRIFVRFEAAGQVAQVFINGQMLGEHRGAFTAFCYELTSYLQYGSQNELRVKVDNTHREDLPPLSGDFNVNGGLYRPAQLIITDQVCISPLDYASPGIYLTQKQMDKDHAVVEVRSLLSNGARIAMSNQPTVKPLQVIVKNTVKDANGNIVATSAKTVKLPADQTTEDTQIVNIAKPHLWEGRKSPYLYHIITEIEKDGKSIDCVEQPLGLRTFAINDKEGFLLNGTPYPIYGVGRHQDLRDKAWAMTADDNEKDYDIIREMGATAIRFAHYPQSQNMHDIADREGFLVWDEIPLVNEIHLDPEARHNVQVMLREMVHQLYNHPSIAWWGLYNEIENNYTPPSEAFLMELRHEIRQLDPSTRIITAASDHGLRPHNLIPEATCFNNYPGWYHGNFPKEEGYTGQHDQFAKWIADRSKEIGKRIAITEYGAGGDPAQHTEGTPRKPQPAHGGPFQPEEWLTYVHEEDWRIMKDNPHLWGTFLWAIFDFASCMRNEGSVPSVNTKGIVSQDRTVRKDPYYLYKANWNPEPMVYITSRRNIQRTQAATDVKVYSNCCKVTLRVNGKKMGVLIPDEIKVCHFKDIPLHEGSNRIEVTATTARGKKIKDNCIWILTEKK